MANPTPTPTKPATPVLRPIKQTDDMTKEEWTQKVRFSARGYKSRLTICAKAADKAMGMFVANPSSFGVRQLQDDIDNMEKALIPLQFRMQELIESAKDEQAYKDHEADLEEYTNIFLEAKSAILNAISDFQQHKAQVTERRQDDDDSDDDDESTTGSRRQFKVNVALKPEKLTPESTPRDLRIWLNQFRSYYETSCMEEISIEAQQAYFKQCLDRTLRFRLERRVDDHTPIWGDLDSCQAVLTEEFLDSYPLFNRRLEFFRTTVSYTHLTLPTIYSV